MRPLFLAWAERLARIFSYMKNDPLYTIPKFEGKNLEDISLEEVIELAVKIARSQGHEKIFSMQKYREILAAEKLSHIVHKKVSNAGGRGSDATMPNGNQAEYKSISDTRGYYESYKSGVKFGKKGKPVNLGNLTMIYNGAYSEEIIRSYSKHDHFAILFDENEKITLIIKVDGNFVVESLLKGLKFQKPGKSTNLNSVRVSIDQIKTSPLFTVVYDFLED
jgi:hypothetical protein